MRERERECMWVCMKNVVACARMFALDERYRFLVFVQKCGIGVPVSRCESISFSSIRFLYFYSTLALPLSFCSAHAISFSCCGIDNGCCSSFSFFIRLFFFSVSTLSVLLSSWTSIQLFLLLWAKCMRVCVSLFHFRKRAQNNANPSTQANSFHKTKGKKEDEEEETPKIYTQTHLHTLRKKIMKYTGNWWSK